MRPDLPVAFDQSIYVRRKVVERCINQLIHWRGPETRYEKGSVNYRALVIIASIADRLQS
jgi:transposase